MNIHFFFRHYIKRPLYQRFVMLEYSKKREVILAYSKQYHCSTFVETGTFLGDTIEFLKEHFKEIYTIELQEDLFKKAKERFKNMNYIQVIQGDSSEVLKEIVPALIETTLFWLDGHYSSSFSVGGQLIVTAKGAKDSPIMEELVIILKNGLRKNIILIDDARCFDGTGDYPTLKELRSFLNRHNITPNQIETRKDIIRIVPCSNDI